MNIICALHKLLDDPATNMIVSTIISLYSLYLARKSPTPPSKKTLYPKKQCRAILQYKAIFP